MELTITKENFQAEVLNSDKPVLVDFWAVWCGPCKMIAPVVAEIAEDFKDTLKVGKINVDNEGELAVKYGVMSIPTLLLFKDGEVVKKSIGFMTKEQIIEEFEL